MAEHDSSGAEPEKVKARTSGKARWALILGLLLPADALIAGISSLFMGNPDSIVWAGERQLGIFGGIGLIGVFLLAPAFLGSLLAIILGLFALRDIRRGKGILRGQWMAWTGTVCGLVPLVLFVVPLFFLRS